MIKWFSAYKHFQPAAYEAWFEKLALEGYHPIKVNQFSSFCMKFKKGDSKKYKYVVDLQAFPKKEYFDTYQNFGWEKVGQMASMFVWRKEYTDVVPEAFSDKESIQKRNARITKAISFSTVLAFLSSIVCWIGFAFTFQDGNVDATVCLAVLGGLTFLAGLLLLTLSILVLRKPKRRI